MVVAGDPAAAMPFSVMRMKVVGLNRAVMVAVTGLARPVDRMLIVAVTELMCWAAARLIASAGPTCPCPACPCPAFGWLALAPQPASAARATVQEATVQEATASRDRRTSRRGWTAGLDEG